MFCALVKRPADFIFGIHNVFVVPVVLLADAFGQRLAASG